MSNLSNEKITYNQKKLRTKLLKVCQSTEWNDAVKEFEYIEFHINEDNTEFCACGHPIVQIFVIEHIINKTKFNIGCDCINQFIGNINLHTTMIDKYNLIYKSKTKIFTFGKYKNKTFNYVYKKYPDYHNTLIKMDEKGIDIYCGLKPYIEFVKYQLLLENHKKYLESKNKNKVIKI